MVNSVAKYIFYINLADLFFSAYRLHSSAPIVMTKYGELWQKRAAQPGTSSLGVCHWKAKRMTVCEILHLRVGAPSSSTQQA